jgi:DNA-binding NarL/FixJ family response regulator
MTKVILADDQKSVRLGLRLLLEQEHCLEIIGEAYNAGSLLANVASKTPDLVLLDWGLPGMLPEQLMSTLRKICPNMAIIVLSGQIEVKTQTLEAGANAFFSKASSPDQLVESIQKVMKIQKRR